MTGVFGRAVAMSLGGIVAAGLALISTQAPAAADTCGAGAGVSVVVDFRELGGGVQTACDAGGGGKSAGALFAGSGFALTYATRQPGFVCRVSGVPASDPCVTTSPTTAYWGLYFSDGSDGTWAYSTRGADSLTIPAGGSVAFAWQGSGQRGAPAVSPVVNATPTATPTPTPTPTAESPAPTSSAPKPTSSPTKSPTRQPTKSPTQRPTRQPTQSSSAQPSEQPSQQPSEQPSQSASVGSSPQPGSSTPTSTEPPSPSQTTSASESPSQSPTRSADATQAAQATDATQATEATEAASNPSDGVPPAARTAEESDRVPTWLTLSIMVLLLVAIGLSAHAARRRTRP